MKTLIVPCAGGRTIDSRPLFLNKHPEGELLAIKAILGIVPESYDRIVYTVLKEVDNKYNASKEILAANEGRFPIEILTLSTKTGGPAETVYETIKQADVKGEFAVRDSHAFISIDNVIEGNYIAGLDLTKYENTIEHLREKSFIVLNEQGQTLDVVEKHFCSNVISVGLYSFKKTSDYLLAYEHLNDPNYPIEKLFVSHIISYLIGYKQRVFHSILTSEYEDWASKASWQKVQKKYSTCFLDLDNICNCSFPLEDGLLCNIKKLNDTGVKFVPFTTRRNALEMEAYLIKQGINIGPIVCSCSASKIKTIASSNKEIMEMAQEI